MSTPDGFFRSRREACEAITRLGGSIEHPQRHITVAVLNGERSTLEYRQRSGVPFHYFWCLLP